MVNRLGALRDARDVAFVNDTDAKFFTLIRFTSKAEYQQVRRMAYDAQSEGK